MLKLYRAWLYLYSGRSIVEVERLLSSIPSSENETLRGWIAPLQAIIATFQGQLFNAAQLARRALLELPEEDRFSRSIAAWLVSVENLVLETPEQAVDSLEQFAEFSQQVGNVMLSVMAVCNLAEIHLSQGRLDQAESAYGLALKLAMGSRLRGLTVEEKPLPISGVALIGLGEVQRELNQINQAIQSLEESIRRLRQWQGFGIIEGCYSLTFYPASSAAASLPITGNLANRSSPCGAWLSSPVRSAPAVWNTWCRPPCHRKLLERSYTFPRKAT